MKNFIIITLTLVFFIGCSSTCMEYRSATTAARSEKNLKRAEEWALKALESSECNPENDALAPYFLATEVYLKQKKYKKMADMLSLAEKRNPDLLLETPFMLGETPVTTISEGVSAYREEEWRKLYIKAVNFLTDEDYTESKKQLDLAMTIIPKKAENYKILSLIELANGNDDEAYYSAELGLKVDSTISIFYRIQGDISNKRDDLESAEKFYLKAIEYSEDSGPIKIPLLNVFIGLGKNELAINYSSDLLNQYPDEPAIYYTVGIAYERMATEMYDFARGKFNAITKDSNPLDIKSVYKSFTEAYQYASLAKDYFLQSSALDIDENRSTIKAIKEMRTLIKYINQTYIPSIKTTARESGIELQ